MPDIAKTLIFIGIMLTVLGIGFYFLGKIPGVGKLPGDIFIKKGNFNFYFPLTTCIILSALITLITFLIGKK